MSVVNTRWCDMYHMLTMYNAYTEVRIKFSVLKCLLPSALKPPFLCISERLLFPCTFQNNIYWKGCQSKVQ